jgi:Mn2+/Fe2+ NRAMP family transporter
MTDPVVTDPEPTASTPEPVLKAAAIYGSITAVVVTVVGMLVAVGALTTDQAQDINGVIEYVGTNFVPVATAILGVTSLISGLAASFAGAAVARRKVTPVAEARVRRAVR